jgi:hypothetical protein
VVFFKAQKFQRLAELEARVQKAIEEAGAGGLDWAEEALADAAGMAGFDLEVARVLDAGSLATVLGAGREESAGRVWLAAETLFLDGVVARAEGREDDARDRLGKARRLYRTLGPELHLPEMAARPGERVERIDAMLEGGM